MINFFRLLVVRTQQKNGVGGGRVKIQIVRFQAYPEI